MLDSLDAPSTRPYLIRALYEWCTDNGFTPFIAVQVNESVRVPMEFVKDGEIVLNVSFDATSALKLGNEYIEFKGRFGGVARDILVPVDQVLAIYARENGQGMAFSIAPKSNSAHLEEASKSPQKGLASVSDAEPDPVPPKTPATGTRPALTRIK
ncbi:ClpXP protease specificity-enhancing factor [Rhodoferax sp.]|uniref:ClpXP protease specificity-enhancing factor n=1 Tax=Rhodoferax sp. TaxID=50421 RepID=UPI0025D28267|nr:ClpXP protease specificity-enhancing factor [Rhodoferax sp.]